MNLPHYSKRQQFGILSMVPMSRVEGSKDERSPVCERPSDDA